MIIWGSVQSHSNLTSTPGTDPFTQANLLIELYKFLRTVIAILSNQGGSLETLLRVHKSTWGLWGSCLIRGMGTLFGVQLKVNRFFGAGGGEPL